MKTVIALICKTHGFIKGDHCPHCVESSVHPSVHFNTNNWVTQGEWEHIDPMNPHLKFNSKEDLLRTCEKFKVMPKAFMKPSSQTPGKYEIQRRSR